MRKDKSNTNEKGILFFLYKTYIGRIILKPLVSSKTISLLVAWFMNRRISTLIIKPFIKLKNIDISEYEEKKYVSFNDFFIRKIKSGKRLIDYDPNSFISPCDAKLTCYKIDDDLLFKIKGTFYDVENIIKNKKMALKYKSGYALVFRLAPDDYHRYCFVDKGKITDNYKINGLFHSVNPVVYERYKVFCENTRECTVIETDNFGTLTYVEVGALLVGKINNYKKSGSVVKAEEKGYFMYGGSTIVILVEEGKIKLDNKILLNSNNCIETTVKYGQKIANKL